MNKCQKKSLILVIFQMITMIYLIMFNSPFAIRFGLMTQIFGIAIGVWGILIMGVGNFNIQPEVKSYLLITAGPYKWIRNPMYMAVILFYVPIVIQNFSLMNVLVFIVLFIAILLKIYSEEQFLEEQFGDKYLKYKRRTKRLIPFIY